jgi:hypothetical protein
LDGIGELIIESSVVVVMDVEYGFFNNFEHFIVNSSASIQQRPGIIKKKFIFIGQKKCFTNQLFHQWHDKLDNSLEEERLLHQIVHYLDLFVPR